MPRKPRAYLGTSMSKLLSRRSRDFFTGIPNIYSASPDSGAPVDYVRAVSSHLNEVELPQSPRTESSRIIPPIVTHLSCLPISPDSVYLYFILPLGELFTFTLFFHWRIKGVRYFLGLTLFILNVKSLLCRDQKGSKKGSGF